MSEKKIRSMSSKGGGVNISEIFLFQTLADLKYPIKNIFIIGNAFGFSTILLSLMFPQAKVIAIDAGCEGKDNMKGIELTNTICKKHNLDAAVEYGFSPQNTKEVIQKHFGSNKIDLCFIDGLHTNEQLLLDFEESQKYCHTDTLYFMHDVINWKMQEAFQKIQEKIATTHKSDILWRTQSGMALSVPKDNKSLLFYMQCFTEHKSNIDKVREYAKKDKQTSRKIARLLPRRLVEIIKKVVNKT